MDKWLRNANVVKVLALCIAILLWVVVRLDVRTSPEVTSPVLRNTTISNVMVQPVYDNTRYSIVSIDPPEVTVILRGKESAIRRINPNNFQIKVDLSKQEPGEFNLPLKPADVLPAGVTVEIIPDRVRVVMEAKEMKEVPVVVNVTGTPAEGYRAGEPIVNPNRVYVTVPSGVKDNVESARAEISVDKATSSVSKQVKLIVYDKNGKPVDGAISPPVVSVEVPVTVPFKTMPLQIKWTGQPSKGFAVAAVQQNPDQVAVYGPQKDLNLMDFYGGPQVDLSGLKEDKAFTLDIPVKNKDFQVDPAKVDVKVSIVPSVTKTFDQIPLKIIGQNDGLDTKVVTLDNGALPLTVEGAPAVIDKLKPQDVQAIIDVSNLPPGTYDINVNVGLPAFVKNANGTNKVTVQISPKQSSTPAASASPDNP